MEASAQEMSALLYKLLGVGGRGVGSWGRGCGETAGILVPLSDTWMGG